MSSLLHHPREDTLEVSILDTVNVPSRKDGSLRQPFFSAAIPSTEQRWQQQQLKASPRAPSPAVMSSSPSYSSALGASPQMTFFFSVPDRQENSVRIALWDRKDEGGPNEHQKLLGECTLPLYYVGWQWVDAKLKLKAAHGAHPEKYAASFVRARLRFTKDLPSSSSSSSSSWRGGKTTSDVQAVEELDDGSVAATPSPAKHNTGSDRKKFWRHTRDLGKRSSPFIENRNTATMELRAISEEGSSTSSVRQQMLLSQPVRTFSLNSNADLDGGDSGGDDSGGTSTSSSGSSDSSDEDDEAVSPRRTGSGLGRRLSRDFTKLRQLLTSNDSNAVSQRRSPGGSSGGGGRRFWTVSGRQGSGAATAASLAGVENTRSAETLPSVTSIDWHSSVTGGDSSDNNDDHHDDDSDDAGTLEQRTFSEGDLLTDQPAAAAARKKKQKKVDKKEKEKKRKSRSGSGIIPSRLKHNRKKKEKKDSKKEKKEDHKKGERDAEEEGWERDATAATTAKATHKRAKSHDDMKTAAAATTTTTGNPDDDDDDNEAVASSSVSSAESSSSALGSPDRSDSTSSEASGELPAAQEVALKLRHRNADSHKSNHKPQEGEAELQAKAKSASVEKAKKKKKDKKAITTATKKKTDKKATTKKTNPSPSTP